MNALTVTERQVAIDDFETNIVEVTETGTIVKTIATVHFPEYAEQFLDNATLRARVDELEQERETLKIFLLRCQQMNYTADGEDAALWNINGEFEQGLAAALGQKAETR